MLTEVKFSAQLPVFVEHALNHTTVPRLNQQVIYYSFSTEKLVRLHEKYVIRGDILVEQVVQKDSTINLKQMCLMCRKSASIPLRWDL